MPSSKLGTGAAKNEQLVAQQQERAAPEVGTGMGQGRGGQRRNSSSNRPAESFAGGGTGSGTGIVSREEEKASRQHTA